MSLPKNYKQASDTANAFSVLRAAISDDPEYAWSWYCNIYMAIIDNGGSKETAGNASLSFMSQCFGPSIELRALAKERNGVE